MKILATVFVITLASLVFADVPVWDVKSDTWIATDSLGRQLPGYNECGPPRSNRHIGIFYFLWLGEHGTGGPYDITKLLAENPDDPNWGTGFHHWGESELGYYLSDDPFVIRKHCHMLVDAGVDTLIFDVSNAYMYTDNYMLLCSVYDQIRSEGGKTPQICFLTHSKQQIAVQHLYDDFYSQNLYPDLWFRWLGKPLILASPDEGHSPTILEFFTFRLTWAWTYGQDIWNWLDYCPQDWGWHESPDIPEELSVCIAQHPVTNIGRSFHGDRQPDPENFQTEWGLCFAEQWYRALSVDPQFIFVTGWNEWVANRYISDGTQWFLGEILPAGESYFVDQYTQEYSRDAEPMKDGHTDNYYYQMIGNIRRYKGVREPEIPSGPKTIVIDGSFGDWDDVVPEFRDTKVDTTHRNHPGWGSAGTYINTTGRNDFVMLKTTRDNDNIYFYAETNSNLSPYSDPSWMLLFIDSDCNNATGWEGYDYLVNSPVINSQTTTLKQRTGGAWSLVSQVPFRASGNKLEIAIPRTDIGQGGGPGTGFDFHWSDNIQQLDDIIEFAVSGDSAPNRRFKYRYNTPIGNLTSFSATITGPGQITLSWTNPTDSTFKGTIIRFDTSDFPADPDDGTLVADQHNSPGSTDSFVHNWLEAGPITHYYSTHYYSAFAYDRLGTSYSAAATDTVRLIPGDFDWDGDVDLSDFGHLQACLTDSGVWVTDPNCIGCNLDGDYDVDGDDVPVFLKCISGTNLPADPNCAD